MTKRNAVRLGIVGCGGIGRAYAQAARDCSEIAIVAACDTRRAAAEELAALAGARALGDAHRLEDVDAVVVSTPPVTHAPLAAHFAGRGMAVLCEKPFTLDLESAADVLRAARRGGARVAMASKFRCVDDTVAAKKLLDSGALGAPVLFENAFTSYVDMRSRWNSDPRISGGGVLIDNGSHALDVARWFVGPLAEIRVSEGHRVQDLAVEETVHVEARSAGGILCGIDLSWSLDRGSDTYLRITGSEGVVVVGWRRSRWRRRGGEWTSFGSGYDKIAALRAQLRHFAAAVRGEEAPLVTPMEAAASVAAVEAGYASLRSGGWTVVPELEPGPARSARAEAGEAQ